MIARSAENPQDRRKFLRAAGMTGLGVVGVGALGGLGLASRATAATRRSAPVAEADAEVSDGAVLNFALNLEYLEPEFCLHAVTGKGLADSMTSGTGTRALGSAAVSRPAIDLQSSFTAAAQAAGIVKPGHTFDAFACEENFLLAGYLFEDVVAEDRARDHPRHRAADHVQVGAADRAAGDAHGRVGRFEDLRIRYVVEPEVADAVPHNCRHDRSS